jgi:hypothetical protein
MNRLFHEHDPGSGWMRRGDTTARAAIDRDGLRQTALWIAAHQRDDGAIPWFPRRKMDPWDHVQCAMGLVAAGLLGEARAAFRFLAAAQDRDGAWPAASNCTAVIDPARETNHAAYLATGLAFLHRAAGDVDFLAEMWPTLDRAMAFVLRLQAPDGSIYWAADGGGNVWPAPLLAGCASMHGSLTCAARLAAELGHDRRAWIEARRRLGDVLRNSEHVFLAAAVPEPPGRYSMDWYYPVLGGAVRGDAARRRLDAGHAQFTEEGRGCRCVNDREWYTVAETCELIIAMDAAHLTARTHPLFDWVQSLRLEDGGYWMGITYPNELCWPPQRPSWTAATVILAADVLAGDSATSGFFRDLGA